MAAPKTVAKALDTCDGVIEIAKNEMLVQGDYVSSTIMNHELKAKGSVCGGRQACLVGSEYLAYGVRMFAEDFPGFSYHTREDFMRNRPGLRLAYRAINEAAHRYAIRHWPKYVKDEIADFSHQWEDSTTPNEGWGEWFFEDLCKHNHIDYDETRQHVIKIVRNAKSLIRAEVIT